MNDAQGLAAVVDVLSRSGKFASVLSGRAPAANATSGQSYPAAWVSRKGWRESDTWDGPDGRVRTVTFGVKVTAQRSDGSDPESALDDLSTWLRNAVAGQPLADSIPALTEVGRADYPADDPDPLLSVNLTGTFAYLMNDWGSTGGAGVDYFAPDYFAPDYFAGLTGGTGPAPAAPAAVSRAGLLTPGYFAPDYFGGLHGGA